MKTLHILMLAVAAASTSALALAQTAAPGAHPRPDANGDGMITKAEAAQFPRLAGRFDQLDRNKDGKLAADEMPMHRGGKDGKARGLRALDTDRDGRISRAEMQAGEAKRAERFDRMDVNKDGYVDRADMQARMAERRAECFGKADADGNGQLSRAEFDRMGEACGHGRGGMGGRMPHAGHPAPAPQPPKR